MKLSHAELDAGMALLKQGGLCELLPPFFEVDALEFSWDAIRKVLAELDLREYRPGPALTLIAAKQRYVVRPIQLLDPIDTLLYSALVCRLAPHVERSRRSREEVFSYRWSDKKDKEDRLTGSYRAFRERALQLCEKYPFVAKADIADFFPSIYVHRLRNALDAATPFHEEARLLESWLMRWSPDTTPTSVGLPVGQLASNLLAEALLVEVDDFLSRDFVFVRYVDDYLIFCASRVEAENALHSLGERLLLAERLNLNSSKTTVETSERLKRDLSGKRSSLAELQDEFVERALGGDPYGHIDLGEVDEDLYHFVHGLNPHGMLQEALQGPALDIQKLSFALQILGALGDLSGGELIVENLESLSAASRQIGAYLSGFRQPPRTDLLDHIARALITYVRTARFATPYQLIWLLEPFTQSSAWNNHVDILRVMRSHNNVLVRRQALLGASRSQRRDAMVDVRLALSEGAWLRRAALFASRLMPNDERKHVWPDFGSSPWSLGSALERAVVQFAKSVPEEKDSLAFDPDEIPF